MEAMTVLSRDLFERTRRLTGVEDAVSMLVNFPSFRTLGDVLAKFAPGPDLKNRLVTGLQVWFPEDRPDSTDRKVRNWLNGKTHSLSKQDAYVISHILELSLEDTNEFLKYSTGESIHWRNPEDIAWSYSILHRMTPSQTRCLMERIHALAAETPSRKNDPSGSYTAEVSEKLQSVLYLPEDALLAFLKEEQGHLGVLHNTAYHLFQQYMELLKRGFSDQDIEAQLKGMTREDKKNAQIRVDGDIGLRQEATITVRDILEAYMYRKLIPVQARGAAKPTDTFSSVQRNIRQNWPDEFTLSKMESRKIDVSRKALILLFLATDGSDSDYYDEDDTLESEDEVFLSLYTRLNTMLNACGFPQLDPRNPFDWVILFCISSGDLWESDARLQSILAAIFPE